MHRCDHICYRSTRNLEAGQDRENFLRILKSKRSKVTEKIWDGINVLALPQTPRLEDTASGT